MTEVGADPAATDYSALNRAESYHRVGAYHTASYPGVTFADWAHLGGERYHFPAALEAAIEQRVHERYKPVVEALKAAEWGRQSALNGWPAMVCPLCGATAPYPVEDYFNPGDGSHEADCLIGIALASLKEATDG